MAVNTRPYFVTYNGQDRMVQATGPAQAVRHIVGAAVAELRPARGAEVAAWVKAGKDIEEAGQHPAGVVVGYAEFTGDGQGKAVASWIADNADDAAKAVDLLGHIYRSHRLTLESFDLLRAACPAFGEAILIAINDPEGEIITLEDFRGTLEDGTTSAALAVGSVMAAIEREALAANNASAGDEDTRPSK